VYLILAQNAVGNMCAMYNARSPLKPIQSDLTFVSVGKAQESLFA